MDSVNMGSYLMEVDSLAWINCDRFINETMNQVNIAITNSIAGDQASVLVHFTGMRSIIQAWSTGLGRQQEDALEVLNTGFLKVFQHIDRYQPEKSSFYTWMRTIILNSCLDFIRKRSKDIVTINEEYNGDVYLEPDVLEKMKLEDIMKLVYALPPATGAVFNLFAIEGYAHKEISGMLNISEGTSKWHLNAARKLLQQQLNNVQPVHE